MKGRFFSKKGKFSDRGIFFTLGEIASTKGENFLYGRKCFKGPQVFDPS
jgi:hypothetical protein